MRMRHSGKSSWFHGPFFSFLLVWSAAVVVFWFGPDWRDAEGFHWEKHFRAQIGRTNVHGRDWKQTNILSRTIRYIIFNKGASPPKRKTKLQRSNLREIRKTKQANWVGLQRGEPKKKGVLHLRAEKGL